MNDQELEASVENLMHEMRVFAPSTSIREETHVNTVQQYEQMYRRSLEDSEGFWLEQAKLLEWASFPTVACNYTWDTEKRRIEHTWFKDGKLNVSMNCLDRHVHSARKTKPAIIWQGDAEGEQKTLSFHELYTEVSRFTNVLKARGIVKGDRVCIYMPMVPELAVAMLACARIGAIHSIIFGGFSAESIVHRVNDSTCKMIVTANCGIRGGKHIPLKDVVDEAIDRMPSIEHVIVYKRAEVPCNMKTGRDHWYHEEMARQSAESPAEMMDAEDPLFILYTSGSTGKPKGVVHTQAGYLLHAMLSHKYIFDVHENDVYWCTADIGWVTGHSYCIYGPLANGCTTLMFEGIPTYPDAGRFWHIIDKFKVSIFYTAPTAIRALISKGKEYPEKYDLGSLRILGTVGEPINPEAWIWYREMIGRKQCPIVDTWWQTETGGIMIAPFPGCHNLKPGSAIRPFFGVDPVVVRNDGSECDFNEGGSLCIRRPWPGIMRTTWGDHNKFIDTYFTQFKDMYFSGDGCRKDPDGDFWLLGRIDDIVNVSGHRIGTAEVESALVSHPAVAEAAVVPVPDEIKGQALYAFVILLDGIEGNRELESALIQQVTKEIGKIAVPNKIQFARALPKTRSGKIMRRILRKIAERELGDLGDTSTLADPSVIEDLLSE